MSKKIILFILFFAVSILSATTFFVKTAADGGDNANDGLSWTTAKAMIKSTVNASSAGDTILVKYGTYQFASSSSEIDITSNRKIISDDGDGSGWNDAEPDSSLCIIDAGNHCRIFFIHGYSITNSTEINGFKITDGYCDQGGGILIYNGADPIIKNCWITENVAYDGGGILIYDGSDPIIENCWITENFANIDLLNYGAGISSDHSSPTIQYNLITYNHAQDNGKGGGICIWYGSPVIRNNVLYKNDANEYGSGIHSYYSSATIRNNIFMKHNIYNSDKRAIYHDGEDINIENNCFYNNTNGYYNVISHNEVSADPKFTDAVNNDFTLTYESPCIDAGYYTLTYDENENHNQGWKEDIGAFEYTGNRVKKAVSETGELLFGGNVRAKQIFQI